MLSRAIAGFLPMLWENAAESAKVEDFVSLYFVILALILLNVLVFIYRLTLAINRLDERIEQFARHLRDLNLYDLNVGGTGVLGSETEVDGEGSGDTSPAAGPVSGSSDTQ